MIDKIKFGDVRETLRFDSIEYHNTTSAPWVSTELFVTGCYKRCPECFNKDLQRFDKGRVLPIRELVEDLSKNVPYKKVTFSGGEPFIQSLELAQLAVQLRARGFFIVCYSGYTAEELPHLFDGSVSLLHHIDILVDGPFIKELLTPIDKDFKFVGSSNQRIINVQKSLDKGEIILWEEADTVSLLAEQEEILRRYGNG